MDVLIGADPELFVVDREGQFVSGHGMIKGTKAEPFKVPDGAVQVDGMALEININPAASRLEFVNNIQSVMGSLRGMVPGFNLRATPVAKFNADYYNRQPEAARELGCDPDYNAWTGLENPRPESRPDAGGRVMRTGAGHIHTSWGKGFDVSDKGHIEDCRTVAKQLDYYVGIYSLLWDPDAERRLLYGKAGAYRVKPYGVEYRTPSNRWLADPKLMGWVYDATKRAMDELDAGNFAEKRFKTTAQRIIDGNITNWPERWGKTYFTDQPMPPQV